MSLKDLKSDLSWYGKKSPGPYKTNEDRTDTMFQAGNDSPSVTTGGYESQGVAHLTPLIRFAGDKFLIDNIKFSDRGTSSRKAQLGTGTRFPIGPEGQVHSFDKTRIGFHSDNKYSNSYGVLHKGSGLADTYTANSPIDDIYNKLNLRDDATPNPGYAKQPFILRGIQRKGKSKNQRWGLGNTIAGAISSTLDLPRGGILTNVERTLVDVLRIGKFLISPRGLGFITRQIGYQLMNPVPNTRLWNPLSLGSIAPMVHINRHVGAGFLEKKMPKLLGALGGGGAIESKLEVMLGEIRGKEITLPGKLETGGNWKTLSQKIGGPGSILGIGGTDYQKFSDTNFAIQKETGLSLDMWQTDGDGYHRWGYGKLNYERTRGEGGIKSYNDVDDRDGLKSKVEGTWPLIGPDRGGRGTSLPGGGIPEHTEGPVIDDYKRMAYGAMPTRIPPKGNKDSKQTAHIDFRDQGQSQALKIGWGSDKKIDAIDDTVDTSLIKFKIGGISFKAYLGALNDAFAGSWGGQQDQGRADSRYLYESFERTISTDFIVPIFKESERATIWGKLQSLAQKTYPVYGSQGFHGQTVNVTIGDMFKNKPMIITDLSYDWDNETPWEITEGKQAPMYTNVSVSFTVLGTKPTSGTPVYSNI